MTKKIFILSFLVSALLLVSMTSKRAVAEISQSDFEKALTKYLATDKGKQALGGVVESYFRKKQQEAAKTQQANKAKQLEDQFKNPIKIDIGNSPVKGPKNAKITIVEFSDFQCPFCSKGNLPWKKS